MHFVKRSKRTHYLKIKFAIGTHCLEKLVEDDHYMLPWSPKSPDLIPCDFFLWCYMKDRVFVPPMPRDIADVRERIIAAVNKINRPMLTRVWQELDDGFARVAHCVTAR